MKNIKTTITVGIPAYNEEANIVNLVAQLLSQKSKFLLEKIVVFSDGSTDQTIPLLRKIKDKRLVVLESKKRIGKAASLNKILRQVKSDLLMTLDADVVIKGHNFLQEISKYYLQQKFDLLGVRVLEIKPSNFLQKVLKISMDMKREFYENWHDGENVYSCHGRARVFSRRFYRNFVFKQSMNEDAYSYFWCKIKNYIYSYTEKIAVYYQLPLTLSDHLKQSRRFFSSQSVRQKGIPSRFIKTQYEIPFLKFTGIIARKMITSPVLTLSYLLLVVTIKLYNSIWKFNLDRWQTSTTTKKLSTNLTV